MTTRIDKQTQAALQAVATFYLNVGWDIRQVMRDAWWDVALIEGHPEIVLNAEGVRAFARFAPRLDAPEIAEQIIKQGRTARP